LNQETPDKRLVSPTTHPAIIARGKRRKYTSVTGAHRRGLGSGSELKRIATNRKRWPERFGDLHHNEGKKGISRRFLRIGKPVIGERLRRGAGDSPRRGGDRENFPTPKERGGKSKKRGYDRE